MAQGGSAGVAEEDEEELGVDGLFNFATAPRQSNQTNSPRATLTGAVASPSSPRDRSIAGRLSLLLGEEQEAEMEYTLAKTDRCYDIVLRDVLVGS